MRQNIWVGSLIAGIGCGEVTAEPIRTASFSITNVEVQAEDSQDPYACKVLPVSATEPDELEQVSIVRLGELAYGARCQNLTPEHPSGCWLTGDVSCEETGSECGGFEGRLDPATGLYQLDGGQHMLCSYPCVRDADCPAADTGTARPGCMHGPDFDPATESGQCMLGCGAGETCPDGFVCVEPGLTFHGRDGTPAPAPLQCVQFHRITLQGEPWPP